MIPEKIGRYQIIEELGRGGMATVYRGHDPQFRRDVAIKVLPPQFTHDPTFRARFAREAETIASLEHPAIVPVYDAGEIDGISFLVMRLMLGGSLGDRIAQGALSVTEAAKIIERIGSALNRAHSLGLVHRDLKPDNILFDQYGDAYLSDFGIVQLATGSSTLTGTGVIGTPAYMSPEQIQGRSLDGRTDIYALGIILYEMLTGEKPYQADTPAMMLVKHMTEPIPPVLNVAPDLPPVCERVISQATAKDRDNRYRSVMELSETLSLGTTSFSASAAWPPFETDTAASLPEPTLQPVPEPTEPTVVKPEPELVAFSNKDAVAEPPPEPTSATVEPAVVESVTSRSRPPWLLPLVIAFISVCLIVGAVNIFFGDEGDEPNGTVQNEEDDSQDEIDVQIEIDPSQPDVGEAVLVDEGFADLEFVTQVGRGNIQTIDVNERGDTFAVAGSMGAWFYGADELNLIEHFLPEGVGGITAMAWSPEQLIALASQQGAVFVLNVATKEVQKIFNGETEYAQLAWSNNGRFVAASRYDGVVELWDIERREQKSTFVGHQDGVIHLAWSPDDQILASGSFDATVRLWQIRSEEMVHVWEDLSDITCLAWSPDGRSLAVCEAFESKVVLFDGETYEERFSLTGQQFGVYAAVWSERGDWLISSGGDGTLWRWDGANGELVQALPETQYGVDTLLLLPREKLLVLSDNGSLIRIDVRNGEEIGRIQNHTDHLTSVRWAPEQDRVAIASFDDTIRIWHEGSEQFELFPAHRYGVYAIDWSERGLVSIGGDGALRLWQADRWQEVAAYQMWNYIESTATDVAWSPNGEFLAVVDADGGLHIWRGEPLDKYLSWSAHDDAITNVIWSPDGQLIATSTDDGDVSLWDVNTEMLLQEWEEHEGVVTDLVWLPEGEFLASASEDETVVIWHIGEAEPVQRLDNFGHGIVRLASRPLSNQLAVAGYDGEIYLFDPLEKQRLQVLSKHVGEITGLAWSHDGSRLVSTSRDGTLILWAGP